MKKKTMNRIKMGTIGCAAIMGISTACLPVHALASGTTTASITSKVQATAPALEGIKVQEKVLTTTSKYLNTHIKVPQLSGMLDTRYEDELNDIMLSHAQKDLAQWEKDAAETAKQAQAKHLEFHPYELYINYNLKSDGAGSPAGIISLEVITEGFTGGTSMPRIDTYNVKNTAEAERVTLPDLLGKDYKDKLDADILARMKQDPDKYFFEEYKGTSTEQTFYIEKGEFVIVFPKYSIAAGYVGSPEFRFSLNEDSSNAAQQEHSNPESALKLDLKKVAKFKDEHGVTMVSLRDVVDQLRYELKWNPSDKTAEVKKEAQWTSVVVGKNSYFFAKMSPKALGAAPVLQHNKLYVPIQFVSDILQVPLQE